MVFNACAFLIAIVLAICATQIIPYLNDRHEQVIMHSSPYLGMTWNTTELDMIDTQSFVSNISSNHMIKAYMDDMIYIARATNAHVTISETFYKDNNKMTLFFSGADTRQILSRFVEGFGNSYSTAPSRLILRFHNFDNVLYKDDFVFKGNNLNEIRTSLYALLYGTKVIS